MRVRNMFEREERAGEQGDMVHQGQDQEHVYKACELPLGPGLCHRRRSRWGAVKPSAEQQNLTWAS